MEARFRDTWKIVTYTCEKLNLKIPDSFKIFEDKNYTFLKKEEIESN